MKKHITLLLLLLCASVVFGQNAYKPSEYHHQKASLFALLPITSNDIVFLGNSITDGGEWAELFNAANIKNRGISADRTTDVLSRLDPIVKGQPRKIFLLIGVNDLGGGIEAAVVIENIKQIAERIAKESPATKLYIQSILPVNNTFKKFASRHGLRSNEIKEVNAALESYCRKGSATYLDINTPLSDSEGRLDARYTNDGLHLMGDGYIVWRDAIKKYVK